MSTPLTSSSKRSYITANNYNDVQFDSSPALKRSKFSHNNDYPAPGMTTVPAIPSALGTIAAGASAVAGGASTSTPKKTTADPKPLPYPSDILSMSQSALKRETKDRLIQFIGVLQGSGMVPPSGLTSTGVASGSGSGAGGKNEQEEIARAAEKARKAMARGINGQLNWNSYCEDGTSRWFYQGDVDSRAVFLKLFNLPANFRYKKNAHSLPISDFEAVISPDVIAGHFRYAELRITGEKVSLNYFPYNDEDTFTIHGTYGI